jgi:hypothetical protein
VRHAAFRTTCQSFHAFGDDRFLLVLVQMGHEWKPPTAKEDKRWDSEPRGGLVRQLLGKAPTAGHGRYYGGVGRRRCGRRQGYRQ